jgi:broad specificity phosphatase PhoE
VVARHLILIRHGAVGEEYAGRYLGRTDAALSERGRAQALVLGQRLADFGPDLCLSSPLRRARETAALALPELEPQIMDDLREIDFGTWECKTFAEIQAAYPALLDKWIRFDQDFVLPGGEGVAAFLRRVDAVKKRIVTAASETTAVITHGGVVRSLICSLMDLPPRSRWAFQLKRGGMATLRLEDGKAVLIGIQNPEARGGCLGRAGSED